MEYAKNNGLKLRKRDEDFDIIFETLEDIEKEDNESDINNRRIYKESRNYFIVKEQQSAKTP